MSKTFHRKPCIDVDRNRQSSDYWKLQNAEIAPNYVRLIRLHIYKQSVITRSKSCLYMQMVGQHFHTDMSVQKLTSKERFFFTQ